MTLQSAPRSAPRANARQRWARRRSSQLPLTSAVRLAVDVFFRFKHRSTQSAALWCDTHHLWMGYETFVYWAIRDASINLPWVVARAADAPTDARELRNAVVAELRSYWKDQSTSLPCTGCPDWPPLP